MAKRYRVPIELIIQINEDEHDFVEHVFERRALDNEHIQASWYEPETEAQGDELEQRRFHMAVKAAIDWLLMVGNLELTVVEQTPTWYLGGWYHRTSEMRPDEGHPLR